MIIYINISSRYKFKLTVILTVGSIAVTVMPRSDDLSILDDIREKYLGKLFDFRLSLEDIHSDKSSIVTKFAGQIDQCDQIS